jgi:DNA-directed RNA polymerase specialized sigma24 family protein
MRAIQSDADQAVEALYRAHYSSLVLVATLLAGDATWAEETVRDAFVAVYRAWRRLRYGDAAVRHLRRTVVTRSRSCGAAPLDRPRQPCRPSGVGQPTHGMSEQVLLAAVRGLPPRQREALVLKYFAQWPDPLIAAAMSVSGRALNAHIRQGMSALRELAGGLVAGGCLPPEGGAAPRLAARTGSEPEDDQVGGLEGGRPGQAEGEPPETADGSPG